MNSARGGPVTWRLNQRRLFVEELRMVRIVDLLENLTRSSTNPGFRAEVSPIDALLRRPEPSQQHELQLPATLSVVFAPRLPVPVNYPGGGARPGPAGVLELAQRSGTY